MKIHPVSSAVLFIVIAVLALAVAHGSRSAAVEVRIEHNYNLHLQVEMNQGSAESSHGCGTNVPLSRYCEEQDAICPKWFQPAPYIHPGYKTLSLDSESSQIW